MRIKIAALFLLLVMAAMGGCEGCPGPAVAWDWDSGWQAPALPHSDTGGSANGSDYGVRPPPVPERNLQFQGYGSYGMQPAPPIQPPPIPQPAWQRYHYDPFAPDYDSRGNRR